MEEVILLAPLYICNSCKTIIGVHEMHGQMHPNYDFATILLANDSLSSLAYPMTTHTPLAAGNFPIKTLIVMQQPTNILYGHMFSYFYIVIYRLRDPVIGRLYTMLQSAYTLIVIISCAHGILGLYLATEAFMDSEHSF